MPKLKQSTAATVLVGPVLDATGLAVTTATVGDFRLTFNGTVANFNANSTTAHNHNGHYLCALGTVDTGTLGRLAITVANTAMAMAVARCEVVPANVFDSLVLGTDLIDANAAEISGNSGATDSLKSLFNGNGASIYVSQAIFTPISGMDAITILASAGGKTINVSGGTSDLARSDALANANTHIGQVKTVVDSIPTLAQMNARTLPNANYGTADAIAALPSMSTISDVNANVSAVKVVVDSLPTVAAPTATQVRDAAWNTTDGTRVLNPALSIPTAEQVAAEVGYNSAVLADKVTLDAIKTVADTIDNRLPAVPASQADVTGTGTLILEAVANIDVEMSEADIAAIAAALYARLPDLSSITYSITDTQLCARGDIEGLFGVENVSKWADLDNNANADSITARIGRAIAWATAEIHTQLRNSQYAIPLSGMDTSTTVFIVNLAAMLAGVWLYEARGVQDVDADGHGLHRLKYAKDTAEKELREVLGGRRRLVAAFGGSGRGGNIPSVGR